MSIESITVKYFKIPTKTPERDGTLEWVSTGLVTVELHAQGKVGLGYTYADKSTAEFVVEHGIPLLLKNDVSDHYILFDKLKKNSRNLGNAGVSSMALSAVDIALWDLKANVLNLSIQDLLGRKRKHIPFYGSGLFINNDLKALTDQLCHFRDKGINKFKMKIGNGLASDIERIRLVKGIIGEEAELFVDSNGFYGHKEAMSLAASLVEWKVTWLEEPVSSDDVFSMKFLKEKIPSSVNLVAGEYCYQISDALRLLEERVVDIIQFDATRCEGVTGILRASHLAHAFNIPVSTHCAPLLHGNLGACIDNLYNCEYFYDHVLIEENYFSSKGVFESGEFLPDSNQKGFGWSLNSNRENLIYEHSAG
jgi:L-alanine-DL-glutamate epimerase-like enolase superfamily enzyme